MQKPKILVILGSTRQGRAGLGVFEWVKRVLVDNSEAEFEYVDLKDWQLGYYDEPVPASMLEKYSDPNAQEWADKVASADGYLVLSPEYNHSFPAVLKNALDLTYRAWNNKAMAFVSWGSVGGARAVEQLRLVAVELQMVPTREAVHLPIFAGALAENGQPVPSYDDKLRGVVRQLLWWANATKAARERAA